MTETSRAILERFLVRKTKKQKQAFRDFLCPELEKLGYSVQVEGGGWPRTNNIVVGNPDAAKIVYTAHYDTCAVLPFPNFITPKNLFIYIVYQILLCAVVFAAAFGLTFLTALVFKNVFLAQITWMVLLVGLCALMIVGPANKNTYNDNTSGTVALVELAAALPESVRANAAFVFFDLEEAGLIGSSFFAQKHKNVRNSTPLINLDCVSDGSNLLLVHSKKMLKDEPLCDKIKESFGETDEYNLLYSKSSNTIYPSDQAMFKKTLAVASLNKSRIFGYYMDKIHTPKDTVFCERNIEYIVGSLKRLTELVSAF